MCSDQNLYTTGEASSRIELRRVRGGCRTGLGTFIEGSNRD